jgi:nitrogenase molybdenum-iron protein alpha/beta subunit
VKVTMIHSGEPIVVSTDNAYVRAATAAMAEVFGKETVFVRGGGSIPIVGDFVRELGIPTVMMGFGLPDDNLHAPNEKFHLANFHRGIESIVGSGRGGGVMSVGPMSPGFASCQTGRCRCMGLCWRVEELADGAG